MTAVLRHAPGPGFDWLLTCQSDAPLSAPCAPQTIKVGDFGMSRFVGADSVATATGRRTLARNLTVDIIGTAHYASPEMLNDELLVRAASRFSLRRHAPCRTACMPAAAS